MLRFFPLCPTPVSLPGAIMDPGAAPACAFVDTEAHSIALQASVVCQVGTSGFSSFASPVLLSWLQEPLMTAASVSELGGGNLLPSVCSQHRWDLEPGLGPGELNC